MTFFEWLRQFIAQAPVYYPPQQATGPTSFGALASLARRSLPRTLGAGVHPDRLPGAAYAHSRTNTVMTPQTPGQQPTGWIYTGTGNLFGQQSPAWVYSHYGQQGTNIFTLAHLVQEGWRPTYG